METKENLSVKLAPSMIALIKLAAQRENITPSEWLRRAADERLQRSKKGSKNGTRD